MDAILKADPARLSRAGIFGICMAMGLSAGALSPMYVSRDWASMVAMAPLALAAGVCFGALLATNVFLDSD
jgi:hypothetical protein